MSDNAKSPDQPQVVPTEEEIVAYLRQDRDFFSRHPGLLSELNLPHVSGKTVSLVEHRGAARRVYICYFERVSKFRIGHEVFSHCPHPLN